jgi:hypothetical protein
VDSQNKFFDGCVPVATGAEIQSGKVFWTSPLAAKRAIVPVKKRRLQQEAWKATSAGRTSTVMVIVPTLCLATTWRLPHFLPSQQAVEPA